MDRADRSTGHDGRVQDEVGNHARRTHGKYRDSAASTHRHDTNIVSMASVLEGCLVGGFGCTVDHNITAGNSLSSTFSRVTLDELWGYIGCLTMNDLVSTANWVHTNAGGGSPDPLHVLYDR